MNHRAESADGELTVPLERVKEAMASVGYGKDALHQIDRWESKRTTGHFGP